MPAHRPHPAKALIVARGDTIKATAAAVGCNANTLGRILNRRQEPWPALRERLAAHLGRAEAELFYSDDQAAAADLAARTRAGQGLPPTVTDPTALARVAGIVNGAGR